MNPYISRTHPGQLVTTGDSGLTWQLIGNRNADGTDTFTGYQPPHVALTYLVKGLYLVLQDNAVYAKQIDGTWLIGQKWHGAGSPTTVKVIDPLAQQIPDPPPVEPPPPPPVTPPVTSVVHPMKGLTNVNYVDEALGTPWQKQCGDWLDAVGTLNGPVPTISAGGTATIDISKLPGDLMIQGAAVTQVIIDGQDISSACLWTDPTSAYSLPLPSNGARPVIVPNDSGKVMIVTSKTKAYRVDRVACPSAATLKPLPGFTPPDLLRIDPTSFDAVVIKGSIPAASNANNRCFGGVHTFMTEQGVPFVRAHNPVDYYPGIGGGRILRCDYPVGPQKSMFVANLVRFNPAYLAAITDLGVKGSGPTGDEQRWHISELINIYYGKRNPRNASLAALRDYYYSADATAGQGPGSGQASPYSFGFMPADGERFCVIETGVIPNTFTAGVPNQDGRKIIKLNGNVVQDIPIRWFKNPASAFNIASWQSYHGGTGSYTGDVFADFGAFMASTKPIGVDPRFMALL